ncbi:MAG: YqjK-like family protein [Zoogloeaceae bacterium]|nr:YqjK-like family protein [Zoogloeaceae bacterium]
MNEKTLELALRKQALQFRIQAQREQWAATVNAVDGALDKASRLRGGLDWLRQNAPILSAAAVVLLVVRPRQTLRWARRLVLAWQIYRKLRAQLAIIAPLP